MLDGIHVQGFKKTLFWNYISNFIGLMPGRITLTLSLMVFISLTEGVGLLLLVPLLQLVGLNVDEGSLGQIAGFVSSIFTYLHIKPTLIVVIIIYILIMSLNAFLTRLQSISASKIEYDFAAHLRKRLFQAITHSNLLYFSRKRSSDLAHALTYEIERISSGTYFFLSIIASSMVLIVYIIFAIKLSGIVTGFIFLVGVILLLALRRRMVSSGIIGEEITESSKNLYSSTLQHLDGMKTIKSYNLEERNIRDFTSYTDEVVDKYIGSIRSYADVKFLFDVGSVLMLGFLVVLLINVLSLPTAALLLLLFLFVRMIPNLV
jgi:ATP-binding cassette subfamily C protein